MAKTDARKEYTLIRGTHVRREDGERKIYKAGTETSKILLTDEEAARFSPDTLDPVAGQGRKVVPGQYELESPGHGNDGDSDDEVDWSFISDESGPSVIKIAQGLDDPDQLSSLREAESSGKNRSTVLTAIDNRLAELDRDTEE